ncbi:MAG: hypothetical protein AABN95_14605 [Acidobacteriota bacterium]
MAKSKTKQQEYEDTLRDIHDRVGESGTTRADMQESLDSIALLCEEAVPELSDESDDDDDDDDDDKE